MVGETWSEAPVADRAAPVRLLIEVLWYDDLLAGGGASHRLRDDMLPLTIGRAESTSGSLDGSALRKPDKWLSGAHATLFRRDGPDVIGDLSSRNGTWVNGVRG